MYKFVNSLLYTFFNFKYIRIRISTSFMSQKYFTRVVLAVQSKAYFPIINKKQLIDISGISSGNIDVVYTNICIQKNHMPVSICRLFLAHRK